MKSICKKPTNLYIYILFALVILCVTYYMPLTHDDWHFFYPLRGKTWWIFYGNGRFIGNFVVTILCRSHIVRAIIKTVAILLMVLLIQKIAYIKQNGQLMIVMLLVGLPAKAIYAESYTWTAGFCNYVLAVVCMLIMIFLS